MRVCWWVALGLLTAPLCVGWSGDDVVVDVDAADTTPGLGPVVEFGAGMAKETPMFAPSQWLEGTDTATMDKRWNSPEIAFRAKREKEKRIQMLTAQITELQHSIQTLNDQRTATAARVAEIIDTLGERDVLPHPANAADAVEGDGCEDSQTQQDMAPQTTGLGTDVAPFVPPPSRVNGHVVWESDVVSFPRVGDAPGELHPRNGFDGSGNARDATEAMPVSPHAHHNISLDTMEHASEISKRILETSSSAFAENSASTLHPQFAWAVMNVPFARPVERDGDGAEPEEVVPESLLRASPAQFTRHEQEKKSEDQVTSSPGEVVGCCVIKGKHAESTTDEANEYQYVESVSAQRCISHYGPDVLHFPGVSCENPREQLSPPPEPLAIPDTITPAAPGMQAVTLPAQIGPTEQLMTSDLPATVTSTALPESSPTVAVNNELYQAISGADGQNEINPGVDFAMPEITITAPVKVLALAEVPALPVPQPTDATSTHFRALTPSIRLVSAIAPRDSQTFLPDAMPETA